MSGRPAGSAGRGRRSTFPPLPGTDPARNAGSLFSFLTPRELTLVLRTGGDPAALTGPALDVVRTLNPGAVVAGIATMEEAIGRQLAQPAIYLVLFGTFAGIALTLALVGVYGVISYAVVRRSREIGLRMALGADRAQILRLIIRQGVRPVLVGGAFGLLGALLLTRFLQSLLYEVRPADPATFLGVVVLLIGVSVGACWVPARRAAGQDPMAALRIE